MKTKIGIIVGAFAIAGILFASASVANAKNDSPKPGWGYGDKNHVHTGPPGQSVHP